MHVRIVGVTLPVTTGICTVAVDMCLLSLLPCPSPCRWSTSWNVVLRSTLASSPPRCTTQPASVDPPLSRWEVQTFRHTHTHTHTHTLYLHACRAVCSCCCVMEPTMSSRTRTAAPPWRRPRSVMTSGTSRWWTSWRTQVSWRGLVCGEGYTAG